MWCNVNWTIRLNQIRLQLNDYTAVWIWSTDTVLRNAPLLDKLKIKIAKRASPPLSRPIVARSGRRTFHYSIITLIQGEKCTCHAAAETNSYQINCHVLGGDVAPFAVSATRIRDTIVINELLSLIFLRFTRETIQ